MNRASNFEQLAEMARAFMSGRKPPRIAVCAAEDKSSIVAMAEAERAGLASPILIGDKKEIVRLAAENHIYASSFEIIDVTGNAEKAQAGVALIRAGKADILMKGMIPTSTFLHPIFRHEDGLLTGNFISHVGVLEVAELGRFILQTDGGLNISPTLEMKKGIIKNAVFVAHLLGIERPKVALLSATEKVHSKIKSTVEARDLAVWAKEEVADADVDGPMALDIALSKECRRKERGIGCGRGERRHTGRPGHRIGEHPVQGDKDIRPRPRGGYRGGCGLPGHAHVTLRFAKRKAQLACARGTVCWQDLGSRLQGE